jgi:hypothetical protein
MNALLKGLSEELENMIERIQNAHDRGWITEEMYDDLRGEDE